MQSKLWPLLGLVTVLEHRQSLDPAFRPGDLLRLLGHGLLYEAAHLDELPQREDLTLVQVVAAQRAQPTSSSPTS